MSREHCFSALVASSRAKKPLFPLSCFVPTIELASIVGQLWQCALNSMLFHSYRNFIAHATRHPTIRISKDQLQGPSVLEPHHLGLTIV